MSHKVSVYPHNDLLNLAHYQIKKINEKVANGDQDGIALDCMSVLMAMAFAVEAVINLIGHKKVMSWKERKPYREKARFCLCCSGSFFQ